MTNHMYTWDPLSTIWDEYQGKIEDAIIEGDIEEKAEFVMWPASLHIGEEEKESVERFITERTHEAVHFLEDTLDETGALNSHIVASYLFRGLITGLLWQQERYGA